MAINTREIVAGGKSYVVDIDLSKFFDRIHHNRLIACLSQQVADKRIVRVIGVLLRSGIMANGVVTLREDAKGGRKSDGKRQGLY